MPRTALYLLNVLYLSYIVLATVLYHLLVFPPVLLVLRFIYYKDPGESMRFLNHLYGNFLVRISWPLIRIRWTGRGNIPEDSQCVIVVNHRSTMDIFFCTLFTPRNTTVFVRSWPFKIWVIGWFMRCAGYIDTEKMSSGFFIEKGHELNRRGGALLFFPEGHRSRDGRLQPFRAGAFLMASELNIPVVPACMTGTEKFMSMNDPLVRPAQINIDILPAVHPSQFPEERRAAKFRKHVESLVKEHLNEP